MADEVGRIAQDLAKALIDAMAGEAWPAVKPQVLVFAQRYERQVAQTETRVAQAPAEESSAVKEAERQAWAVRLDDILRESPEALAAARVFLLGRPAEPTTPTSDPSRGSASSTVNAAVITAGAGATVTSTQKKTDVKVSIPILSPLFSLVSTHPVVATAVVLVVGGASAAGVALTNTQGPTAAPQTSQAFKMADGKLYDFDTFPPKETTKAESAVEFLFDSGFKGHNLLASSFNIGTYQGAGAPKIADCRSAVESRAGNSAPGIIDASPGLVVCFIGGSGEVGYFTVKDVAPDFATVQGEILGSS